MWFNEPMWLKCDVRLLAMLDAESIDQGIELRRAKASEMADEEIDCLGDPLATDEERQLRKQRLIKGPQEFRDIRSNRAKIKPGFLE
jgi:hypothetical protein